MIKLMHLLTCWNNLNGKSHEVFGPLPLAKQPCRRPSVKNESSNYLWYRVMAVSAVHVCHSHPQLLPQPLVVSESVVLQSL